jgi:predicted porin
MKKTKIAFVALISINTVAYSQSSVTLYGILDEGINYNSNANGNRLVSLASGVLNGSRWGLRSVEDLGGGTSAIAVIENGFDVNTGKAAQGGLQFGRQAFVGLSNQFGKVTAGRQYDSVVDYVAPFTVGTQWGGYLTAHPSDIDNFLNTNRVNNAVKYTSPILAGLSFGAMYSLGGVAGDLSRNQIWSVGTRFETGPFSAGLGYLNVRNPNTSFYGSGGTVAPPNGGVPGSNLGVSPVISNYASAHALQVIGAGAAYVLGAATLGANYSNSKFMNLGDRSSGPVPAGGISGTATFNSAEVSLKYQFTPAFLMGIAYDYTHNSGASGVGSANYHQAEIGADYFLSKRTDVYTTAVYQAATGIDSSGRAAVASINQLTPSTSNRQTALRFAIRHRF